MDLLGSYGDDSDEEGGSPPQEAQKPAGTGGLSSLMGYMHDEGDEDGGGGEGDRDGGEAEGGKSRGEGRAGLGANPSPSPVSSSQANVSFPSHTYRSPSPPTPHQPSLLFDCTPLP